MIRFTLRGQGRFRDLVVTRIDSEIRPIAAKTETVIPYEVWSTELWALLAGELNKQAERQGQRRRK